MKKEGQVHLDKKTNHELDKLSSYRRQSGELIWRKKDIVAQLIANEHAKEFK